MWQIREQPRFARPMPRHRHYSVRQSLAFLIVIPMDIALLVIVIVLVGLFVKLI